MSKTKSETLRVNLTPEDMQKLVKISEICGDDVAVTARKAIISLIAYAERHEWRISFPIILESDCATSSTPSSQKKKAA